MTAYATAADLAGLPGWPSTERRARDQAARMGLPCRPRAGRGGGVEYAVDALPSVARTALAARRAAAANDGEPAPRIATAAQARARGTAQAAHVTGWRRDHRDAIARVLVLFQRFWQAYGGQLTPALRAFVHAWNGGLSAIGIDADASLRADFPRLSFSRLRAWHLGVQDQGLQAITPPEHHRKGQFAALQGEVGNAVLALLVDRPHLSATAIYAAVGTQFADLPSERAFRRALAYWKGENAQLLESLTNPDAWRNRFMAAAGRADEGIVRPNQMWQMDSTVGDVMLADGRRHAVVGVIDVYTRRRLFMVTRTSRSAAIMSLIRRAIAAWGVPESIKTDNGQDYVAQQLEQGLLGLGIEHLLCAPFSPHQKPYIERGIGALMHELFELLDGYVGHSVAERKGIEARRSFADRLFDPREGLDLRLTPEALQARVDAYCEQLHASGRDELGGCTPDQMAAGHPMKTVPERALDVFLSASAERGLRVVGKKGIRIGRGHYNHAALGGMEGMQVQVKVDDANLGRAWIFDMDGAYVCEAIDHQRLGISSAEVAAERTAHQKRVLREAKEALKRGTRSFDPRAALDAIHARRTQDALTQATAPDAPATNVVALAPRPVHSSPGIDSVVAAQAPDLDAERVRAEAERAQALVERATAAPATVTPLRDTPQERYARWMQLQARVERGEALTTADERNWFDGYAQGSEWAAMRTYFETFGLTPEQVLAG